MAPLTLPAIVARHPYPDFQDWWPLGSPFIAMMSSAILEQWRPLFASSDSSSDSFAAVEDSVTEYIRLVYGREARPGLVADFADKRELDRFRSGEFDALSYAFFRSAYASLARQKMGSALHKARRQFAERVGARFFALLSDHLSLDLPRSLTGAHDFMMMKSSIGRVGGFLHAQGYLRSHFGFRFDVSASHAGKAIEQSHDDVLDRLAAGQTAYAIYEMGHPVILPSAVYLYLLEGEAQHHSSRTIEELFARVGCNAWETDDFDPSEFSSDFVVELWEIQRAP